MEIREFYGLRVDDLKPVRWHEIAETYESDELIYLVYPEVKRVVIADVGVRVAPQNVEATEH
jgi:hypothetical protein